MELVVILIVFLIIRNVIRVIKQMKVEPPAGDGSIDTAETTVSRQYEDTKYEGLPEPLPMERRAISKEPESVSAEWRNYAAGAKSPDLEKTPAASRLGLPFNNKLGQTDIANGIIWSQILGPRGGLRGSRRGNRP